MQWDVASPEEGRLGYAEMANNLKRNTGFAG